MSLYSDLHSNNRYFEDWYTLVSIGIRVFDDYYYQNALTVAREIASRSAHNIETLVHRLEQVGYRFAALPSITRSSRKWLDSSVMLQTLPISLLAFYEQIDMADLRGTHPDWRVTGYDINCDDDDTKPLVLTEPLQVLSMQAQVVEQGFGEEVLNVAHFHIHISDNIGQRAGDCNIDGGDSMIIPSVGFDAEINQSPTSSQMVRSEFFVRYLRRSFAWGGFPGFANVPEELRPTEMLDYLREGLLPI